MYIMHSNYRKDVYNEVTRHPITQGIFSVCIMYASLERPKERSLYTVALQGIDSET